MGKIWKPEQIGNLISIIQQNKRKTKYNPLLFYISVVCPVVHIVFLVKKIYYSSVEKKQTGIRNSQIHLGGNAPRITKPKLCIDEYQYWCIHKEHSFFCLFCCLQTVCCDRKNVGLLSPHSTHLLSVCFVKITFPLCKMVIKLLISQDCCENQVNSHITIQYTPCSW